MKSGGPAIERCGFRDKLMLGWGMDGKGRSCARVRGGGVGNVLGVAGVAMAWVEFGRETGWGWVDVWVVGGLVESGWVEGRWVEGGCIHGRWVEGDRVGGWKVAGPMTCGWVQGEG